MRPLLSRPLLNPQAFLLSLLLSLHIMTYILHKASTLCFCLVVNHISTPLPLYIHKNPHTGIGMNLFDEKASPVFSDIERTVSVQ